MQALRSRPWSPLVALSAGLLLAACSGGGSPAEAPPTRGTRLILIVLDTLRADHLGLYGYDRPTSPSLERLASQATVYTRAQAAAPWTLPSHASLFTGRHPYEHGARTWPLDQLQALAGKGWKGFNNVGPLPEEHATLAEVLRDEGYATGAAVANLAFMDVRFGIAQGFETYDKRREPVEGMNARALAWLDEHGDGPAFLFVNYMDTHRPYNTRPRDGWEDTTITYGNALAAVAPLVLDPTKEVPPALLQACVDQYDLSIANLDEGLGTFFDALRERDLFDDSLIIVTSDHGEFLGEKQLIEHSKDVYQGALHVPLIVKAPGQTEGAVDTEWIGHVNVPALALQHLELADRPAAEAALVHHPRRRTPVLSENYFARSNDLRAPWGARFDRVRRALLDGDLKLIESSDGQHELFDLGEDPGEERSLWNERPKEAERLQRALSSTLRRLQPAPLPGTATPLSPELLQAMRDLGYVGDDEPDEGSNKER